MQGAVSFNIGIGQGGNGGDGHDDGHNFDWSGHSGENGTPTTVTGVSNSSLNLTVAGGLGGGRFRNAGNSKDLSGGTGGAEGSKPSGLSSNDIWSGYFGGNGSVGRQDGCPNDYSSRGGSAGLIPANSGSLTHVFTGGAPGIRDCSGWDGVDGLAGAGGSGGRNSSNPGGKGGNGGNGQVRIIITYFEQL